MRIKVFGVGQSRCLGCENQGVWAGTIKVFWVGHSRCLGCENQAVWDVRIKLFGM